MTPDLVALLKRAIAGEENTAFLHDDGKTYVRYTSMHIRPKELKSKGLFGATQYSRNTFVVQFDLDGDTLYEKEVGLISFAGGDSLTLTGVNGLYEIEIESD